MTELQAAPPSTVSAVPPSLEKTVVILMAAVQFVNVLDFMMVTPLGPDFAVSLSIPVSRLALVGGSYTAAASLTGLTGSFFLDRFDRRKALLVSLVGLAVGTFLGGLATGLGTLLLARVVAGAFGGPATSMAVAIVADTVPPERRGRAMGIVMGAFAIASVLGVPAGLKLAEYGGFRLPFFGVAALILAVTGVAWRLLPSFTGHLLGLLGARRPIDALRALLSKPTILLSLTMTGCANMGAFVLVLNIAAFTQYNLGFPRSRLDQLYLFGGLASFVTMRLVGRMIDRVGSTPVSAIGTLALAAVTYLGFVDQRIGPSMVMPLFVAFFVASATRNVAYGTLTSKVPEPQERARFLSIQSAVQHASAAAAAGLSTQLLTDLPGKRLGHMERAAYVSIAVGALVPILMVFVEKLVRGRSPLGTNAASHPL